MVALQIEDISQASPFPTWVELVSFASDIIDREKQGRLALGDVLLAFGDGIPPRGHPVGTQGRYWLKAFAAEVDAAYGTLSEWCMMADFWTVDTRDAVEGASYTRLRDARAMALRGGGGVDEAIALIHKWLDEGWTIERVRVEDALARGKPVPEQTTLGALFARWRDLDWHEIPATALQRDGVLTIKVEVG
jgi:hypothetical protein